MYLFMCPCLHRFHGETQILPRFGLFHRAAQQIGRMIGDNQRDAIVIVQRATQRPYRGIFAEQRGGGGLAQSHDQLGLDEYDLPLLIRQALRYFVRCRRAIIGRAAFDDVGDLNFFTALELDRHQHIVEQLARLPHKRLASRVLILARPFTDKQPVGLLIAHAEHRLRASGAQPASGAIAHDRLEL